VAKLSDALAARFRLSRADRASLVFAALLHDLGEMTMKRDYIQRAGPLNGADSYAALTDARPFRPAGTEAEARKHLTLWAGLEFDPHVVQVFLSLSGLAELRSYARAAAPPELPRETAAIEVGGNGEGAASVDEEAAVGNEEAVRKDEVPAVAEVASDNTKY
jgi:hypothetical protein